jgi:hypothetical protein
MQRNCICHFCALQEEELEEEEEEETKGRSSKASKSKASSRSKSKGTSGSKRKKSQFIEEEADEVGEVVCYAWCLVLQAWLVVLQSCPTGCTATDMPAAKSN